MNDLAILNMARRLAEHAASRQALVAENVANADTPRYRALDLAPFADAYDGAANPGSGGFAPAATRAGHATGAEDRARGFEVVAATRLGAPSPNGNTVSLEDQMARAAEVRLDHDMALGVWRKSMDILRASLGRPR